MGRALLQMGRLFLTADNFPLIIVMRFGGILPTIECNKVKNLYSVCPHQSTRNYGPSRNYGIKNGQNVCYFISIL